MSALVAPSGECLRGEGLMWLIGAMMWSLAAYRGSSCSLERAMEWTAAFCAAAPLALADQLPLLMIIKRDWSAFRVRRAI